jgi:hypothetical protein
MVIGAARFAVKQFSDSSITPVSAWVYPQDSTKAVYDYELAASIVKFFSGYIGPYPFEKLANVQSKTIFGGMENAGAIFYAENTVTGTRKSEALLAHEIAHQWFGKFGYGNGLCTPVAERGLCKLYDASLPGTKVRPRYAGETPGRRPKGDHPVQQGMAEAGGRFHIGADGVTERK